MSRDDNKHLTEEAEECIYYIHRKGYTSFDSLSPTDAARLVYLASFMRDDGEIIFPNGHSLESSIARTYLHISQQTFKEWLKTVCAKKIITPSLTGYKINQKYFTTHKSLDNIIQDIDSKSVRFFPICRGLIRELYHFVIYHSGINLMMFVRLIPYIHPSSILICKNPNETDTRKIKPLSIKDITRIIYKVDDLQSIEKCSKHILSAKGSGIPYIHESLYQIQSGVPKKIVHFVKDWVRGTDGRWNQVSFTIPERQKIGGSMVIVNRNVYRVEG